MSRVLYWSDKQFIETVNHAMDADGLNDQFRVCSMIDTPDGQKLFTKALSASETNEAYLNRYDDALMTGELETTENATDIYFDKTCHPQLAELLGPGKD